MRIKHWAAGALVAAVMLSGSLGLALAHNDKNEHAQAAKRFGSTLEVHLYDDGKALVRGAKVTAVSGGNITAFTAWGSANLTWTVQTGANTDFVERKGGRANVGEVKVGDFISFHGELVQTAGTFTVQAKTVKNWSVSIEKPQPTTVQGKLKTLPGATAPTTMVVAVGDKDYTVRIASDTSLLNVFWLRTSLSGFKAGDTIRIYGQVNADATIDATVIRNVSLK